MFEDIAIVIYNSQDCIKDCLNPIKKLDIKTIIVDNLSGDETTNIAKKIYLKTDIIKFLGNIGYRRANNIELKNLYYIN